MPETVDECLWIAWQPTVAGQDHFLIKCDDEWLPEGPSWVYEISLKQKNLECLG